MSQPGYQCFVFFGESSDRAFGGSGAAIFFATDTHEISIWYPNSTEWLVIGHFKKEN